MPSFLLGILLMSRYLHKIYYPLKYQDYLFNDVININLRLLFVFQTKNATYILKMHYKGSLVVSHYCSI